MHAKNIDMDYLTYTEKINYLLEMIEKGRLTSLQQAAEKFDCSQSTIKRMLSLLRGKGYVIYYCRTKKIVLKN